MVLTIFMTLFTCVSGVVGAYVCTHCCCLCGGNSNSSNDSSNTAFKERIKYLTNLAVKEWMRIDVENMQRQYVAIENAEYRCFERFNNFGFSSMAQPVGAEYRCFERFNNFNFIEPEPEMADLIDYEDEEDDEDRVNLQPYEVVPRTIEGVLDKWVASVKRIIEF